jgi:hypothetical protein
LIPACIEKSLFRQAGYRSTKRPRRLGSGRKHNDREAVTCMISSRFHKVNKPLRAAVWSACIVDRRSLLIPPCLQSCTLSQHHMLTPSISIHHPRKDGTVPRPDAFLRAPRQARRRLGRSRTSIHLSSSHPVRSTCSTTKGIEFGRRIEDQPVCTILPPPCHALRRPSAKITIENFAEAPL